MRSAQSKRLDDLERASGHGAIVLHFAEDGDDHAAEWRRLMATGKLVRCVTWREFNENATAEFLAAMPEGARI